MLRHIRPQLFIFGELYEAVVSKVVKVKKFSGSFTQQKTLPKKAFEAAEAVLKSAGLHRYGSSGELSEASLLEREFAKWQGAKYCLACASGGQAMQIALRAVQLEHDEPVLTNGFTLAPVPGAIKAVGGKPILVEITEDLVIDCDDLANKAKLSGARILMLSHMRGHIADMDKLAAVCETHGITIIEDCAHTMGATWGGEKSGNFGRIGCFSTQTYKHINSGEGGLITTDDPEIMARAIILSGSYMNYDRHGAAPEAKHFEVAKFDCPNMSARMDNLRAAILLPQLEDLDEDVAAWNERHAIIADLLTALAPSVKLPKQHSKAIRVGSSFQFSLPGLIKSGSLDLIMRLSKLGIEAKWFGREEPAGFTSAHTHWKYVDAQDLPITDSLLAGLFDIRLPLSFSLNDCTDLAQILAAEINETSILNYDR